jgi:hypothetical protein
MSIARFVVNPLHGVVPSVVVVCARVSDERRVHRRRIGDWRCSELAGAFCPRSKNVERVLGLWVDVHWKLQARVRER